MPDEPFLGDFSAKRSEFELRSGFFVVTLWRDWLTAQVLAELGISDRQVKAVAHVKHAGQITNSQYRNLTGVTRKTAARDLDGLVEKGAFKRLGEKRGSYYVLKGKK